MGLTCEPGRAGPGRAGPGRGDLKIAMGRAGPGRADSFQNIVGWTGPKKVKCQGPGPSGPKYILI